MVCYGINDPMLNFATMSVVDLPYMGISPNDFVIYSDQYFVTLNSREYPMPGSCENTCV